MVDVPFPIPPTEPLSSAPEPVPPIEPAPEPAAPARPTASPGGVIVGNALRSWFSTKGFILVLVATLLPVILAGAWIGTHQRDVAIVSYEWSPAGPFVDDRVSFTATLENPKTLAVGNFTVAFHVLRLNFNPVTRQISQTTELNETIEVGGLGPGEQKTVNASWTPNVAAVYVFRVEADPDWEDRVAEIEEHNNLRQSILEVQYGVPPASQAPRPPTGLGGDPNATTDVDLAVQDLRFTPGVLNATTNATFEAVVANSGKVRAENARATLRFGESFNKFLSARNSTTVNVTLDPGATMTVTLEVHEPPAGGYWAEAFVAPPTGARETSPADNYRNRSLAVSGQLASLDPPVVERQTIKEFYLEILLALMIPVVLPFIALFYAGGAVSDERERGNLTYLLTRPFGRGSLPILKFVVGFLVAAVAVLVGVAVMYVVLLGTPDRDPGYLTTPLLMSLFTLFVYGSFFTLLAVMVDRAYLAGIALVLGWEYLVPILINLNLLAANMKWFTMLHHLQRILREWGFTKAEWLPLGSAPAMESVRNLAIAAVVFLGLAYWTMRSREFEA